MICCPLDSGDGDGPSFHTTTTPRARREHHCVECKEAIRVGDRYERTTGSWDGTFSTYLTCLSCVEIRDHFACDGFLYGCLWDNLRDNFFPEMRAGGPCLEGLSPESKQRLFDERTKWAIGDAARRGEAGQGGGE